MFISFCIVIEHAQMPSLLTSAGMFGTGVGRRVQTLAFTSSKSPSLRALQQQRRQQAA
jgi:hypothetical protein